MNSNQKDNKVLFNLLVKLHQSDSSVDDIEIQYLKDVAVNLGLSSEDIDDVIKNPENFELDPPASEQERMTILYHLLFGMRVDGIISKKETEYITEVGLKLGFNELMTTELMSLMGDYLHEKLPDEPL